LGIDLTSDSPELQRVAITCGVDCGSFYVARDILWVTRRIELVPKEIERMCHRAGRVREAERQALVSRFEALPLAEKEAAPPEVGLIPEVVAVEPDGGRYQQRIWDQSAAVPPSRGKPDAGAPDAGASEAGASEAGTANESSGKVEDCTSPEETCGHSADAETNEPPAEPENKGCWREDKNAVLLKLRSQVQIVDPAPQIPEGFLNITAMGQLAREIKNARQAQPGQTFGAVSEVEESDDDEPIDAGATYAAQRPEVVGKQVVATTRRMPIFGALLAAQAWELGFYAAKRRAYLGDGLRANWTLWRTRFPTFTPILDFIHLLTYVYGAAFAGQTRAAGTALYQTWIQWAWSGRADDLIAALQQRLNELPAVVKGDVTSPQSIVQATLRYVRNNRERMNYPEYRCQGLPITTSLIESTVKQINLRVKGTEKFWSAKGAEAILQLRADVLSDFNTLDDYFARRESQANGVRSYRPRTRLAA
jgi:hypothetical protein